MYRKDFTQLTDVERDRLAAGFNHLWANGTIASNAALHDDNFYNGIHWGPAFLPWHRDFLRKLELALQAFDSRITLPYWDWTRADSRDLDAEPWRSFFGGRGNSGGRFDHWTYTRASAPDGSLPTLAEIIAELQATSFFAYRLVESGSHVPGHVWTGGSMATGASPLDPLFYLHHCNLDRLWAIWQQNHPSLAQYSTTTGHPRDTVPQAVVPIDSAMVGGTTPREVLDHRAMGFRYERDVLLEIAWYEAGLGSLATGDQRPADMFVRDSSDDHGSYPSPRPHWSSPDIWVRNEAPSTTGENPEDGHEVPIVDAVNYLYVRVNNRGSAPAQSVEVEAFHCNPGTAMLWPDDFASMGTLTLSAPLSPGSAQRIGPFLWTPTVEDHECLVAVVRTADDPSVTPMFIGSVPHWHLIRFDNNVGQRNVAPVRVALGGSMQSSMRVRGGLTRTSNRLTLDARRLPSDTNIRVRVANSMVQAGTLSALTEVEVNERWTTLEMSGGALAVIDGFELAAREDLTVNLAIDFSVEAEHGVRYPLVATQEQDGQLAGELTVELTAIKDSEDFVYGNPRSKELHTVHCQFWSQLSPHNKIPFRSIREGVLRGYNGCAFCLPEHDTDRPR